MIPSLLLAAAVSILPQTAIQSDCDPTVIETRGINSTTYEWEYGTETFDCRVQSYEVCDEIDPTICWSIEKYICPGTTHAVGALKLFDAIPGEMICFVSYTDTGLCATIECEECQFCEGDCATCFVMPDYELVS